ncbi:hypothetical protein OHD62_17485 [Mesorhizobium sp. YC-39]|uniref:hypothetical protein n=1 Tax=unclassified Mesorhizobium TaxID=325217 RepID=UPI0021E7AEAF|nr:MULTISPECIES: hypothetical protein [unclassified Mesorhizobium]MCV3209637.1 hypothetical protein [Mesorhizobium sp. YC-2]MCV3230167.1 hypothetical protein [Mesorhizobium sp. YC-39]
MNTHHRLDRIEQMFDSPADQHLLCPTRPQWDFPARLLIAFIVLAAIVGAINILR